MALDDLPDGWEIAQHSLDGENWIQGAAPEDRLWDVEYNVVAYDLGDDEYFYMTVMGGWDNYEDLADAIADMAEEYGATSG